MPCPDRRRLELALASALDPGEATEILEHAASCPACADLRRRIEAAPGFWKPIALALAAVSVLFAGALVWMAFRAASDDGAARRHAEASVRRFLAEGRPEKAAGALESVPGDDPRLRIEVARASAPEEAAKILEPISLDRLDPALARETADLRLEIAARLFRERVLRDGAVPAPFDLRGLRPNGETAPDPEEMSRHATRLLHRIAQRRDLDGGTLDPATERLGALARIARYALGAASLESAAPADDESRFQLGDLLYRERRFDRALETWRPIPDDPRVIRRHAELAALRRFAPKTLHVWDYEAEKLLGRDAKLEAQVAAGVEALFKRARPGTLPLPVPDPADGPPMAKPVEHVPSRSIVEGPIAVPESAGPMRAELAADPTRLYLLTSHDAFSLRMRFDRPYLTKAPATASLSSLYTGAIRFRLYRVPSIEALRTLTDETIAARRGELSFVREWEREFAPLHETGKNEKTWTFEVPSEGPGLFVLLADARYCPVLAVARFIVTDVALVQQPALDRVLVYAADRLTGSPVPELALEGEVTGRFVVRPESLLPSDDGSAEEFRRGFDASWAGRPAEAEATASYRRGFEKAAALRSSHPDTKAAFRGATDRDGLFEWTVAPEWRPGYEYSIATHAAAGATYTRVDSAYAPGADGRTLRAVVYTDRPLYRPGDTVSFKGLLRTLDGEGLHPYEGREALFEFWAGGRVVHARTLPVGDFGTAAGAFDLPAECPQGLYLARVNNGPWVHQLFHVEEFRKSEVEVSFRHPRRIDVGATVDVEILLRTFTGEPVVDAPVAVGLSKANADLQTDDWGSRPSGVWNAIERRALTTDAAGRCVYRFRADPGAPTSYAVTARVTEESRREVTRSTSLESVGTTREILVEAERPSYHPGETARLRLHVPGAATIRLEERAKLEQPFKVVVALVDGKGTCEYPVPAAARDLQAAVREGDGWVWTPVAIRIVPRPAREGLVGLQLDRPTYRVGETALVRLESTEPDQAVLLTVATGRIHRRLLVRLADRKAELPLEVRDEDVPNVTLVALALRHDVLERATTELRVPPVDRFLTVEVSTDRGEYRPGQDCAATVRVLDSRGRPVPDCEISLGVVDEAIYALYEDGCPDLREFFHRYERPFRVGQSYFFQESLAPFYLWKAPVFVKGQRNLYDVIGGGAGGGGRYGSRLGGRLNRVAQGGGGMGTSSAPPRSTFKDTAYWNAQLRTGPDGTVAVVFPFPDNLTSFRFTARGITKDHKVGSVRQNVVVRMPFYTRIAASRVLQEGNTLALLGLVHNYTGEAQTVTCSFKAPFPVLRASPAGPFTVLPGQVGRVDYEVSVDRYLPEAELTLSAEAASGARDAVAIKVPGRRRGTPFHEGRSGSVAGGVPREEVFRVPDGALPGSVTLRLSVDADLHSAILEGLEPLIEYPYGCVEQTMSRFFPAVAANRALGDSPHRWKEKLPSVVATGLARLYALQNPYGGWGWWGDGQGDSMTAYVLYGLAQCRRAGTGVDRSVAERAAAHLRQHLEKAVLAGTPDT